MVQLEYINLRILSKRLGVAKRTLRNWIHDPISPLPAYKVKGLLLFKLADVEQWLEKFRVKTVDTNAMADEIMDELRNGKKP